MGQVVGKISNIKRVNLAAIQSGGSLAKEILGADEVWLVDTTNSLTNSLSGNCDAYIVGDGQTAASELEVISLTKDIDAIIGSKELLMTIAGSTASVSNGYIKNDGTAVVPTNTDWRKTDSFIQIPNDATMFSFKNGAYHPSVAAIAFYSAASESSFISAIYAPTAAVNNPPTYYTWNYDETSIPSGAKYVRVSFVVSGTMSGTHLTYDIATQFYYFWKNSTIKQEVEKIEDNIGTEYDAYPVTIEKYIAPTSAINFERLHINSGVVVSISQDSSAKLDIYYAPTQTWTGSGYTSMAQKTTANPFTYTFVSNAGCIRVYNNGTSLIKVTLTFNRSVTAKEQIQLNQSNIERILERVGGVEDTFSQIIEFREPATGSLARLWTSSTLTNASKEKEWLVIMCHGNSVKINGYTIPTTALTYFRANKINVASIQYQDLDSTGIVGSGFNKYAWGNYSQMAHVIALYDYLQANYNFHKEVVLAGCSMGGLVMGAFAYKKPFPIAFCLGIGPVPSLKLFWDNSNSTRKAVIRAAYDMPSDGSDDANVETYFQGHDWWKMGRFVIDNVVYKIGFPDVYLYYGNDSTFRDLFGGTTTYNALCESLKNGGVYSKVELVDGGVHDTTNIWTKSVQDNIWHDQLGVPSYTE